MLIAYAHFDWQVRCRDPARAGATAGAGRATSARCVRGKFQSVRGTVTRARPAVTCFKFHGPLHATDKEMIPPALKLPSLRGKEVRPLGKLLAPRHGRGPGLPQGTLATKKERTRTCQRGMVGGCKTSAQGGAQLGGGERRGARARGRSGREKCVLSPLLTRRSEKLFLVPWTRNGSSRLSESSQVPVSQP